MIDYSVFPVADIDEEKSANIDELNLVPRSNVSKDKVLMKCQHYEKVFPEKVTRIVTTDEEGSKLLVLNILMKLILIKHLLLYCQVLNGILKKMR